jgi:HK97 family phage major capsid protein
VLEFDEVDEPVRKIATHIPVSDELLSDSGPLAGYLNARLALFVRMEEEAQLVGGAGDPNLLALLPRIPVENRFVVSDADTPNAADHIYAAIAQAEAAFLAVDTILVNPVDWTELRLVKDDNLNYIGGSPFSNTGSNPGEALWGRRVIVTTAVPVSYGVVGAFGTAAQVYRRGGLTVEATNSHDDWFVKDQVAVRAEVRVGLGVLRPASFAIADLGGAS